MQALEWEGRCGFIGVRFLAHTPFTHSERTLHAAAARLAALRQSVAEVQLHEKLQREVLRDGVPRLLAVNEDETHLHLVFEYSTAERAWFGRSPCSVTRSGRRWATQLWRPRHPCWPASTAR
jgi:hypothetical protein